jgi:hypothetical protein
VVAVPSPCATPPVRKSPSPNSISWPATYDLFHATRAELLRTLGHPYEARTADQCALELTANPAERALLHQRPSPWQSVHGDPRDQHIRVVPQVRTHFGVTVSDRE